MATNEAKESSVKRVMYLTKKLKLNATKISKKTPVHKPTQRRNSIKSMPLSLQFFLMISSKINIGPVAEMIFKGWPENIENRMPVTKPAIIHSIVPLNKLFILSNSKIK
jgi:hypothetical protein